MKRENIMVDLETMGTSFDSAITQIGAVIFDFETAQIIDRLQINVSLSSSVEAGLIMEPATVLWWLHQSAEARKPFIEETVSLPNALSQFSNFILLCKNVKIWGNGAAFDNVILANAYKQIRLKPPWEFYNDRCYRTVKNMRPDILLQRKGTHHRAVDDAESQAIHLMEIYNQQAWAS